MTDLDDPKYTYSFQAEEKGYAVQECWSEYIDTDSSLNEERDYYNGEYRRRVEMIIKDKLTETTVLVFNYTKIMIYEPEFGSEKVYFDINHDASGTRIDLHSPDPELKTKEMRAYWIDKFNLEYHADKDTEIHRYKKLPKIKCDVCKKSIYPPDIVIATDTLIDEFYEDKCQDCAINAVKREAIEKIKEQIEKLQEDLKRLEGE